MSVDVAKAVEALRAGGVIVYPTDTTYGLGALMSCPPALEKGYEIKRRPKHKPIHVMVADLSMAERYVELTPLARRLADVFLPGALTLVLRSKENVPEILTGGTGTLGVRIPDNEFCLSLARELGEPYTATSANQSDAGDVRSIEEAKIKLGESRDAITFYVNGGELPYRLPSTVVDARGEEPIILREGAIPAAQIARFSSPQD